MTDTVDTSAEAVEALGKRLGRKASLKEHGMWCSTMDDAAAALRTLLAEREAAQVRANKAEKVRAEVEAYYGQAKREVAEAEAEAARLREAHAENARLLGLLVNDLQGRIEGGKLAALIQCWDRAALAKDQATREGGG